MVGSFGAGLLLARGRSSASVNDFLPPEILFQGTPFAINRIILIRIVATVYCWWCSVLPPSTPSSSPAVGRAWSSTVLTSCVTRSFMT